MIYIIKGMNSMGHIAKIFMNGRSQAVRLPAEFRFSSDEVYIHRDEITGDVVLSSKPYNWDGLISAIKSSPTPDDFLSPQDRNTIEIERDPFHGLNE
jgi:antitoxin VapB